jgi:hypothetical protein
MAATPGCLALAPVLELCIIRQAGNIHSDPHGLDVGVQRHLIRDTGGLILNSSRSKSTGKSSDDQSDCNKTSSDGVIICHDCQSNSQSVVISQI